MFTFYKQNRLVVVAIASHHEALLISRNVLETLDAFDIDPMCWMIIVEDEVIGLDAIRDDRHHVLEVPPFDFDLAIASR